MDMMDVAVGTIQTIVGTGEGGYAGDGGLATQALIGEAYGCDFDPAGNLYISDGRTHTIRRLPVLSPPLPVGAKAAEVTGPATEAGLERPHGCGIDSQGHLYIVDGINHRVRVVRMR